jgi:hypothetical protein
MVGLTLAVTVIIACTAAALITQRLYVLGFLGLVPVVTFPFRKRRG